MSEIKLLEQIIRVVSIGFASFLTTNVDDLLLLIVLFSSEKYSTKKIVSGQFLGIFLIILVSWAAALLSRWVVPQEWTRFFGLAPIGLGVLLLINKRKQAAPRPIRLATTAIAAAVFSSGGDNIPIYTAILANLLSWETYLLMFVYSLMTALWCALGYILSSNPRLRKPLQCISNALLPFLLIGIGISVLFRHG